MNRLFAAAVVAPLSVLSSAPAPTWTPLDKSEIAAAHPCFVTGHDHDTTILAICAGKKRIDTGIRISNDHMGTDVDPKLPLSDSARHLDITAETILQQVPPRSPWHETIYVLTQEQLDQYVRAHGGKAEGK